MFPKRQSRPCGPFVSFLLVWNGLGALCTLLLMAYFALREQQSNGSLIITWSVVSAGLWFFSLPFTTLLVTIDLWPIRKTAKGAALLLHSLLALVAWLYPIVWFVGLTYEQY